MKFAEEEKLRKKSSKEEKMKRMLETMYLKISIKILIMQ
jgi:hypothetical protein